jgi:alkylation response protein AidB-like acyl-CoA dehydrogenase
MDLESFRRGLDDWLDRNESRLAPPADRLETLEEQMAQLAKVKRMSYDAGWNRWGWPERVGGLGGPAILRAYLGEALTYRGFVEPGVYSMTEVLAPTMIQFAPPELAASMVPRLLTGEETWCQGFSEPGTGSNLASLSCRAARTNAGWLVNGQKVWTSYAQFAQRCVLLTRTGTPESAHRGITALFVDMSSPGISVRPLLAQHGSEEFCEVFFDDVRVPFERTLGEENEGWAVAMDLLPYERSTSLWHRCAYVQRRLELLLSEASEGEGSLDEQELGMAVQHWLAFRARSRATQHRMDSGEVLGAETSVDKVLIATAEQAVFDLVASSLPEKVMTGDDPVSERWRSDFLYSRAATIYGGSAEIQRNIIARRVLNLGEER